MSSLPKSIGRYRVIAKLGQGGMARVLLGLSEGPGDFRKLSVIKQLRTDLGDDADYAAMFLDEARLAALLNHPNVVQTNEVGELERFISMEYLEGQSLSRVLRRTKKELPLNLHIHILLEALTGLHYVHELTDLSGNTLAVVHRDVSPGNLFLTYDGQVKLLDFGIAKAQGSKSQTKVGSFKGKIAYMAPEQAQAKALDRRADVFAAGVLLWEALAKRPFVAVEEADIETLRKRVQGLGDSIDAAAPDSPRELRAICAKAMALNPDDRYQSAAEFRDVLDSAARALDLGMGSREGLASLMTRLFAHERKTMTDLIAKTISLVDPFDDEVEMIASWEASDSMWLNPEDLETAQTSREKGLLSASELRKRALSAAPVRRDYFRLALIAVGGGLIAGAAAYVMSGQSSKDSVSDAMAASQDAEVQLVETADAAPPPVVEPTPSLVHLSIAVTPLSATIAIDGTEVSNPHTVEQEAQEGQHTLTATSPGYVAISRPLRLDRDLDIQLTLEELPSDKRVKAPRVKAPRVKAPRVKAPDTVPPPVIVKEQPVDHDAAPKPPKKPQPGDSLPANDRNETRTIDKDNPYQ